MHEAVSYDHIEIIKFFLAIAGDDAWELLRRTNTFGGTVLHRAAQRDRVEIAQFLLNAANDKVQDFMTIKTKAGIMASDIANPEMKNLMLQYYQDKNNIAKCQ